MDSFWDDSDEFTGPTLTDDMIRSAEASLGYKLPASYLRLIATRNGGRPRRSCYPTRNPESPAGGYIALTGLRGIGGEWGIDAEDLGSRQMIREWGYPDVGVVVGETLSAGHETVMLDYSECGPQGEPRVIHVDTETDDEEPRTLVLAPDFEAFVKGLVDCAVFDEDEEG